MLKDVLTKDLDVVFCGTAKGTTSALKGFYYAGAGNQFYRILQKAGFTSEKLLPENCYELNNYKIGLTDLVFNQSGNDNDIDEKNYDVKSFLKKMETYQPKFVAFNGKKSASVVLGRKTKNIEYGLQQEKILNTKLFVLPSTSGSARKFWDELYWFDLKNIIH